jgi:hypothetical protein
MGRDAMTMHMPSLSTPRPRADAPTAAEWLSLAAAPTFALMALLTAILGGGAAEAICSAMPDAWPLGGMAPMYLLMSLFHAAPWLKRIAGRR